MERDAFGMYVQDDDYIARSGQFFREYLEQKRKEFAEKKLTVGKSDHQILIRNLYKLSGLMQQSQDTREIIDCILDACQETVGNNKVIYWLYNAQKELSFITSRGSANAGAARYILQNDAAPVHQCVMDKKPVMASNPDDIDNETEEKDRFRIFYPIILLQKTIGILYIDGYAEGNERLSKQQLGTFWSYMIAEAIGKAQLRRQTELYSPSIRNIQHELSHNNRLALRNEIASKIGHEINNTLSVIFGNLDLTIKYVQNREESNKIIDRLARIADLMQRTFTLADGLLNFSHSQTRMARCDLNVIVNEFFQLIEPIYRKKGVRMHLNPGSQLPRINADPAPIQQLLLNLVKNAIEVRPDAEIWIKTVYNRDEKRVKCSVKDNGPGMEKLKLSSIFEPLYLERKNGHGYGLAVCKEIIENHGGSITVESEIGKGSEFIFSIPECCSDEQIEEE